MTKTLEAMAKIAPEMSAAETGSSMAPSSTEWTADEERKLVRKYVPFPTDPYLLVEQ